MAAHVIFSQHSSNPLEVPTSDPQNARYRREIERMHQRRFDGNADNISSDDPLAGYQVNEELKGYQTHLSTLFPEMRSIVKLKDTPTRAQELSPQRTFVEPPIYSSDDELEIVPSDHAEIMEIQPVVTDGAEVPEAALPDPDIEFEDSEDEDVETDEELSILLKTPEEREEIEEEIADLEDAVPQLTEDYKIVDRLGTGTFSSVYKAIDLGYETKWHNGAWHGNHPPESSAHYLSVLAPPGAKVFVAIKRIYVTSNPERIRNEIVILEDCRGCRHVSQLITAFRHRDQVVAVMPYHRNDDFRDIFKTLPMAGIKSYFRCLLRALRDIHSRGIIHRDVKPANFLFDARTQVGTLCDFGLACIFDRPHPKANRAGTRGFRAPEVLLKCSVDQVAAIDIWSTGMILLFFLTGKFPLFQSNDDIEALMEIAAIIGKRRMECAATLHSRTFATNVPSITRDGMSWREFVERNNHDALHLSSPASSPTSPSASPCTSPQPSTLSPSKEEYFHDLELAFDFLEKLLLPESIHRITARDALYHPFLAEAKTTNANAGNSADADLGDDAFFPHPIGDGRCGKYHFLDEVTEEHSVHVMGPGGMNVRVLQAGQGIPIGNRPCEFHKNMAEFQDTPKDDVSVESGQETNAE
ncbi:hypothetical protein EW145_g3566 [Phellinidium pouzarii]|uniref:non-specific serine/threonine protein kinase n=1 Tax=Phellinidium pouzarii TaxID=167371 RepID=A0A4S4L6Y3_9AGAM|nr:hypothetical protein EW145_g3566 [Phellinidium pouzarii]